MNSKFGVGLALGFVVLIALAFAAGDISSYSNNSKGGDRVATIGGEQIHAIQLSQAANTALENLKQKDPRLTMKVFVGEGGLDKVLDQLLDNTGLAAFGRKYGIVASERLIDSEIAKIPGFKGPDGQFSDAAFRQMLQQRGLTEQSVRDELAQGLIARQLMVPAEFGSVLSRDITLRYAALLREHRSGAIGLLPAAAFAPKMPPNDGDLQAFYVRNRDRFIRPERRVIRYAAFSEAVLKTVPAPTEQEIAARYEAGKAQYSEQETRRITQLIVPTEAAAKTITGEIAQGKSLETVAGAKGLAAASLGSVTKDALAKQTTEAVADAAFAANRGGIGVPARSPLGWHVLRIDGIDKRAARSLDQVRGELVAQLTAEKRRTSLNDLSARIEDEFSNGGNIADAAKELGLTLQESPALTADGQVYGQPGKTAPPLLTKVLQTAFSMEREGQPQLAEIDPGKAFLVFDVTTITASAAAPLSEIRADVASALAQERGTQAAKAAGDKVLALTKRGTDLGAAIASLGLPLPPVQSIDMGREQLSAAKQQVPPPLLLLFSMARGTTKLLPAPNNQGWFVVSLKEIAPGKVDPADPMLQAAQGELGQLAGREYSQQLAAAIRKELGVKRDVAAMLALRNQLIGGN
ncbi:MAG: SurA N-terminal domain-containing protein [Novosphingobium sp.]